MLRSHTEYALCHKLPAHSNYRKVSVRHMELRKCKPSWAASASLLSLLVLRFMDSLTGAPILDFVLLP